MLINQHAGKQMQPFLRVVSVCWAQLVSYDGIWTFSDFYVNLVKTLVAKGWHWERVFAARGVQHLAGSLFQPDRKALPMLIEYLESW